MLSILDVLVVRYAAMTHCYFILIAKLVTRDTRVVERKKPGLAKARKSYTW
jgi:ribosomal protein S9